MEPNWIDLGQKVKGLKRGTCIIFTAKPLLKSAPPIGWLYICLECEVVLRELNK